MPHDSQVLSVWFDDTDKNALTLTLGGQASVWSLARLPAFYSPVSFDGEVIALRSDAKRAIVVRDNRLRLEDEDGELNKAQPTNRQEGIRFCRFRGDDLVIGWVGDDATTISRLKADGTETHASITGPTLFGPMDYEPQQGLVLGGWLFNRQIASSLEVRRFDTPKEPILKLDHDSSVTAALFAPSGRYLLSTIRQQAYAFRGAPP